jgi:hypothetical protein
VTVITSRVCNHITWFSNSAFVFLLVTLSHKTWIASDFHHLNFFKNDRNVLDCIFWNFFLQTKNFFFTLFCTQNRHSTIIENYIKRNDVIKCDFDHLTFIEIRFIIEFSQIIVAKRVDHCHKVIQISFTELCREIR